MGGHTVGICEISADEPYFAFLAHNDPTGSKMRYDPDRPRQSIASIFACGLAHGVCRQIRAEAQDLQFAMNIFHLDTPYDLGLLTSRLSARQLSAIREISVNEYYVQYACYDRLDGVDLPPWSKLTGIKRIFCGKTPSWYENGDMSEFLEAIGVVEGLRGVDVVFMDALDRDKNIQNARIVAL